MSGWRTQAQSRCPTDEQKCESPGSRPSRPALWQALGLALRDSRLPSRTALEDALIMGHSNPRVNLVPKTTSKFS